RAKLQAKGTRSAKRLLARRRKKEARFGQDVNHTTPALAAARKRGASVSKRIVATAQGTGRGIALEDLTHIRTRITACRPQRATLHSWSFYQLRQFVSYKAQRAGVALVLVDPTN